jgi:hypothetical protein
MANTGSGSGVIFDNVNFRSVGGGSGLIGPAPDSSSDRAGIKTVSHRGSSGNFKKFTFPSRFG